MTIARSGPRILLGTALAAVALSLIPATAHAAPFAPTRFDDPIPGACDPGDCSLREAIRAANLTAEADTITLQPGTYFLDELGEDDTALAGDLDVTQPLIIQGAGAAATTIDGMGHDRIFHIDPESMAPVVNTTFRGLTITGGDSTANNPGRTTGAGWRSSRTPRPSRAWSSPETKPMTAARSTSTGTRPSR